MQPFPWESTVWWRSHSALNICVTLVHPAGYEEIRPDIAYIRSDIIHIRPDVGCHLFKKLCKAYVTSSSAWESTAGCNSYPAGCYGHPAGYALANSGFYVMKEDGDYITIALRLYLSGTSRKSVWCFRDCFFFVQLFTVSVSLLLASVCFFYFVLVWLQDWEGEFRGPKVLFSVAALPFL